jgi:hypothetical protein
MCVAKVIAEPTEGLFGSGSKGAGEKSQFTGGFRRNGLWLGQNLPKNRCATTPVNVSKLGWDSYSKGRRTKWKKIRAYR